MGTQSGELFPFKFSTSSQHFKEKLLKVALSSSYF